MTLAIGIDIGGTNLRLGVVDGLQVIDEMRFEANFSQICQKNSPQIAWQTILHTLEQAISAVITKHPTVKSIGIGFPGFIAPVTGNIAQSPNLPGLKDVNLAADLSQLIGLNVIVENDALAAAYGEFKMMRHGSQNLIYIGLGTGVGGGLILNGQPFQGQHGVAMEVGHIIIKPNGRTCGCGNLGCMEQYASASGVAISYFEATKQQRQASEIAALANKGDQAAIAAYSLAGKSLAEALAHILKVIDVANVVVGGGMSAAWPLMEQAFNQKLAQDLIPALRGKLVVSVSAMGDQAGVIGAALLASQKI